MKNILIITSTIDYTVDYIIDLYRHRCNFYRVNVNEFYKYEFNIDYSNGFNIRNKYWNINEKEITAIYYRKPILPDLKEFEPCYHNMISKDIIAFINGFVDGFEGKVLSKPSILRKTENKVYQMKMAKEIKFKFPKTSIGTNSKYINNLIAEKAIIKPLTTGKIIKNNKCEIIQTSKINQCIEEDISLTPLYVQEYIGKKFEVRITIIGNYIFPVKISPYNKIDWRIDQQNNKYSICEIPNEIRNKCFYLLKKMNLKFGAFDFVVNNSGEYIFLEVNPNGQWLWLEKYLNLNISECIMKYLLEE